MSTRKSREERARRALHRRSNTRAARGAPSAVVLAAGASSRFLGTKQLAEIGGKTLIETVILAIPAAEVGETVVVLGHKASAMAERIGAMKGIKVVVNQQYRAGMATSIRAGISALGDGPGGALLLLADQPFVTRSLLRRMLKAFAARDGKGKIVAAAYRGLVAPPVIFSRSYFHELTALRGNRGARSIIERHPGSLHLVRVRSRDVFADIDTREGLEAARRLLLQR